MRKSLVLVVATALTAATGAVTATPAHAGPVAPVGPAASVCQIIQSGPIISNGSTGQKVRDLQVALNTANQRYHFYPRYIVVDGIYGPATASMLAAYLAYFPCPAPGEWPGPGPITAA